MDLRTAARDPWVRGQFALVGVIALGAPIIPRMINLGPLDPLFGMVGPRWLQLWGGGIFLAGIAVIGWGARSLGPSLTPAVTPLDSGSLVETGAYARVRHPIYLGVILLLTGYTLGWSNLPLAGVVWGAATFFFSRKAGVEESLLVARYSGYAVYRRRVPMLWPWSRP